MRYSRAVFAVVIAIAAISVALLTSGGSRPDQSPEPSCGNYRTDKIVRANAAQINTEVVVSQAEQERGLSGRPCIDSDRGMLFIFGKPSTYAIWMKDMEFPIDILWIGPDHRVVGIEKNVKPSTYPDRFVNKDKPAQFVLELPANKADELKVDLSTAVNW